MGTIYLTSTQKISARGGQVTTDSDFVVVVSTCGGQQWLYDEEVLRLFVDSTDPRYPSSTSRERHQTTARPVDPRAGTSARRSVPPMASKEDHGHGCCEQGTQCDCPLWTFQHGSSSR